MIIDYYFDNLLKYKKKYGNKTVVLMEVGSFFEMYGIDNSKTKIGNAKEIATLLNIALSRKNKSIIESSRKNPLMAGFPSPVLSKYIPILLQNNFTVVLIEQTTPPPNPERDVTKIYSPGTDIDNISSVDENNISSIFIESITNHTSGKKFDVCGVSTIDLSTGKSTVYEIYDNIKEDLYQYIESKNPKEIIIIDKSENNYYKLFNHRKHYIITNSKSKEKINYLNTFFKKIFDIKSLLTPLEFLDLNRMIYAATSLCYLLHFCYEHDETIINKLNKPTIWDNTSNLQLCNNSLYQLNITEDLGLLSILNKTSTPMGKRFLRDKIMKPFYDKSKIEEYYNYIETFDDKVEQLESFLNNILDVERLLRRINLDRIHPHELYNFYLSINYSDKLFDYTKSFYTIDFNLKDIIQQFKKVYNFDELAKYLLNDIETSIFNINIYPEVDEIQNQITDIMNIFEKDLKKLNDVIDKTKTNVIKLDYTDKDGYYYITTKKRYEKIKGSKYKTKAVGSSYKLFSTEINNYSNKLIALKNKIKIVNKECFIKSLQFFKSNNKILDKTILNISKIDYIKSNTKCKQEYNYSKPTFNNKLSIEGLRHPVIERLDTGIEYVKNDISFNEQTGILLFGLNGVGKSSLMKAVGLNIIMAQAGMYVPADSLEYTPYKKIFTRISGEDNIFKGKSSFMIEMEELRSILKYADNESLVLGDEICRGTETISALSIVTSSVLALSKKKSSFIFATHLHKLDELVQDDNIQFLHLHVEITDDNINYIRKLRDGIGSSLYGIEVAKYLLENDEFINETYKIRNKILEKPELLSTKTSTYNSKLYMDKCQVCSKTNNLDTHHIKFQSDANEFGNIDHIHKDDLCNLIVLCEDCHNALHHGNINIKGFNSTLTGLQVIKSKKKHTKNKKYTEDMIKIIKKYKDKRNKNYILESLQTKHNIKISKTTLTKIFNDSY